MSLPAAFPETPDTRWLSAVTLAALVLRLLPIPLVMRLAPIADRAGIASDTTDYYIPLAQNLARHGEFSLELGHPTHAFVPLYPLFLAGLEFLGLSSLLWRMLAHALVGAVVLVLLFVWARQVAGPTPALVAAGIAAALPDFAVYSYILHSETLFMAFVLAALILCRTALDRPDLRLWFLVGALVGLAALTREFGLTLLLPLACAAWLHAGLRQAVPRIAVMTLAVCLTLLPWTLRNYRAFGRFLILSSKAGVNIYVGTLKGRYHPSDPRRNWAIEDPAQQAVDRELRQITNEKLSALTASRFYLRAAWQNYRNDPWGQFLYLGRKAWIFWQPNLGVRHAQRIGQPVLAWVSEISYWLCLLAAAFIIFLRRRLDRRAILPALLLAWTFLFHVVVGEAEPRYHFALLPAVFIFAGMTLDFMLRSRRVNGAAGAVRLLLG